jgi:hypothetical protein
VFTRRTFLKTGLAGGALLALAAAFREPLTRRGRQALMEGYPLVASERTVVAAIASVILRGVMPGKDPERGAALSRVVDGVAVAVSSLGASAQWEISELFALLMFPPTRIAVAGLLRPWEQAADADIESFLAAWRDSRFGLLQSGYQALHDLVLGAWYADPSSWAAIGYPGPPQLGQS